MIVVLKSTEDIGYSSPWLIIICPVTVWSYEEFLEIPFVIMILSVWQPLRWLQNPMVMWSQFASFLQAKLLHQPLCICAPLHILSEPCCVCGMPVWALTHCPSPGSHYPKALHVYAVLFLPPKQSHCACAMPPLILMYPPWPFVLYGTSAPLSFCCAGHLCVLPVLLHTLPKHCWSHITPPWPLMHPPLSGSGHQ